ncbi:uridine diphosphate-N-acetylglucosamine-binding protein YvcK [Niameybacter massiliensis]|uniref:Putative gluconeogenesis factor n=1 Tax=Holtiella tumoricola TaxID=3018743 RepID=A0AA42J1G8_9FIRM|nr:uridine diphosphate-N-acetylglucosamine-binding protein YvcK [Holtiella tumoricola]MDA3732151.1 uridine diphosphate-N-acetylglucosamine-binding protein YvcK [Holtiella tumoricola]
MNKSSLKVVAIGGGTGLSTMLRGIKKHTSDVTAIVTVSDNGGGSGILREEMNMVPPGDIRNCLVALANTEPIMKELLQYRFKDGTLKGQNFGNLFLAALADLSGNFEKAVQVTSKVLAITGKVLPVTLENVQLYATFENGDCVEGETQIVEYSKAHHKMITDIRLEPKNPQPAEEVIEAIEEAEILLLGPGSLYTSIVPNLLIEEVANAIRNSKARKIYIANMMSQPGETTGFTVEDHVEELEKFIGEGTINTVIVNNENIPEEYLKKYIEDGAHMLHFDAEHPIWQAKKRIEAPLVRINHEKQYIRHNQDKLAEYIFNDV